MLKKIKLKEAVGTKLAHDITEIRPGEFKGPAFRKGHTVCEEDLCRLQRLGKNHLYVIDKGEDEIHENEAAAMLAKALAGD
ncbi:MAG: molybdopterin-binding protein, partial [Phycisphaerae bacterium]|nr:molybdopterin-binding protein [Phycisphaerae bacterium]